MKYEVYAYFNIYELNIYKLNKMNITIISDQYTRFNMTVNSDIQVDELKQMLYKKFNIKPENQLLKTDGVKDTYFDDTRKVCDYGTINPIYSDIFFSVKKDD